MKAVGIKALKDNLSKYLRLVRSGETVWVTDRDEVIAEIHKPTIPVPGRVTVWETFINRETRNGSVKRAIAGNPPSLSLLLEGPGEGEAIDLEKLIDEVRSDRDLLL